ncbi:PINIT domain-containing protein [Thamnocephalis sphaerospora]|uniref:PINIT domain-containing protein n=1 Tax=Thamnocephalis sphaerospora TaxID=78915 RepID=A0A4P9XXY0_9FUNG|nr:PINIT domain-containing protein [Thamnocephalis sphaerospora]|eukprot:RKP10280.1 PINIT domain-containing protein [Thamnocephalis sphaerospora]
MNLQAVRDSTLNNLLLTQLKDCIRQLNEHLSARIRLTGPKATLVERIYDFLRSQQQLGNDTILCAALDIVNGTPSTSTPSNGVSNARRPGHADASSAIETPSEPTIASLVAATLAASPTSVADISSQSTSWAVPAPRRPQPRLRFRECPFHQPMEKLSLISIAEASVAKSSIVLRFSLTSKHIETITGTAYVHSRKPISLLSYRVAVYSVDADAWIQNPDKPMLMEFPSMSVMRVNEKLFDKNLRGLKNRPGTVHPIDVTMECHLKPGAVNQVELSYMNTNKRYALLACMVKVRRPEELVSELVNRKSLHEDDVRQMLQKEAADADISATSSLLSLRCPLTCSRIRIPCRFRTCKHLQCVDALSFIEMNAQTPTWQCPVCNQVMASWQDLVRDEYFASILSHTSDQQESVLIDECGNWSVPAQKDSSSKGLIGQKRKASTPEAIQDDDDGDGDDASNNEASTSASNVATPKSTRRKKEVVFIDLTLSSDEEEAESAPAAVNAGKRQAPQTTACTEIVKAEMPVEAASESTSAAARANNHILATARPAPTPSFSTLPSALPSTSQCPPLSAPALSIPASIGAVSLPLAAATGFTLPGSINVAPAPTSNAPITDPPHMLPDEHRISADSRNQPRSMAAQLTDIHQRIAAARGGGAVASGQGAYSQMASLSGTYTPTRPGNPAVYGERAWYWPYDSRSASPITYNNANDYRYSPVSALDNDGPLPHYGEQARYSPLLGEGRRMQSPGSPFAATTATTVAPSPLAAMPPPSGTVDRRDRNWPYLHHALVDYPRTPGTSGGYAHPGAAYFGAAPRRGGGSGGANANSGMPDQSSGTDHTAQLY